MAHNGLKIRDLIIAIARKKRRLHTLVLSLFLEANRGGQPNTLNGGTPLLLNTNWIKTPEKRWCAMDVFF